MFEFQCPNCRKTTVLPNVLKCPYCNKDLSEKTDELSSKHIRKCAFYLSPYQYSDRKRGRPKAVSVIEELDLRGDVK